MKAAWMVVAVAVGGCARSGDAPAGENGSASLLSLGALNVRVPSRANAPIRIERAGAPGVFLEVTALGARDVPGQALDGRTVFADAFPETEVVHTYTSDRVEELRRVARGGGDRSLHYRIALGPELSRLRVVNGVVEALDRNGIARLRTERAWFVDATGTKRWLEPAASARDGAWSLDYAIDTTGVEYPITIDPAWTPTTFLAKARRDHALIVLPTGKVIAISGSSTDGITKTTEIYDPATSSWTAGGSVITPRWYFGSALLTSGKIFLIGNNSGTETPELFDPVAGTSEALPDMPVSAYAPTVTELPGGKVLVVAYGGAMVFDLTARTWGSALGTESGRDFHSVAPLGSGKFLIAGGLGTGAALYDSSTSTWKAAAPMHVARENPALQPLPGGKALAAAGCGVTSAEIYDSSTNTWTMTGSLTQAHCYGGSVVLGSGRVLVVAGDLPDGVSDLAEEFDPTTGVWRSAGHLSGPRDEFGIVPLPVERALVVGGTAGVTTPAVEIFAPMELGKTCVGPAECASGFCVEGVCCAKSACGADETCAGSGAAGTCAKTNGATCAADADCGSAHCVDGVCCDTACSDVCGACDLAGRKGTCTPVAAGDAPHGKRGPCPGSGVCVGKCGGVDKTKCTQFPGTAISCAAASCTGGAETQASGCDGAGACAKAITRMCDPYACDTNACKTQCAADTDCTAGNQCDLVTRSCVIAATCIDDHTVKSPEGTAKECAPYRCVDARCADSCSSSDGCAAGYVCDTASSRCMIGTSPGDEGSGGCAIGWGQRRIGATGLSVLLALCTVRRRRRLGIATKNYFR